MGHKKLIRFNELKTFDNVLEYPNHMKGAWNNFFTNEAPITLELACGKGEYAVGLGRMYPTRNFIGVDVKGNRIWRGAKTAIEESLTNVAFIRSQIDQITNYFETDEVAEIWITFPDPQLRWSKMRKRLTHPKFLRLYQQFLQKDGCINLKTDSPHLYRFTKEVIKQYGLELIEDSDNVFALTEVKPELMIKTHYESLDIAQSNRVHYLKFKVNKELPIHQDAILKESLKEVESDLE